jgi:eukaryotic-like serine/threonine-protein kinase
VYHFNKVREPIPLDEAGKRLAERKALGEKARSSARPVGGSAAVVFGPFHLDLVTFELRKDRNPVKLALQPARVLALLVGSKGEVVSRDELRRALWGDLVVDFEHGLNNCMRQIRAALGDDADKPRFIETLPKRGYRFVAPVEAAPESGDATCARAAPVEPAQRMEEELRLAFVGKPRAGFRPSARFWILLFGGVVAVAALASVQLLHHWPALAFQTRDFVLVADFVNSTGDPRFDQALTIAFTVSLEQSKYANVFPRLRLDPVLKRMGKSGTTPITSALGREICERQGIRGLVSSAITRVGREYRLTEIGRASCRERV